jgi:GNAT superfamily N-acetyltransferase
MDATERRDIIRLDANDVAGGLALSTEAHWNQTAADWRYFLEKGIVFGIRAPASRLIATAALLPYTAQEAWISMVLVAASWRRRGLATRLLDACLAEAERLGLTVWLDATPAGAAVYGRLGFTSTFALRRLRLDAAPAAKSAAPLPAGQLSAFIACDCGTIGFSRRDLLGELGNRPGSLLVSNGEAIALVRDGRAARHIGPLFATDAASALALVAGIAGRETGPLLIDAVAEHATFLRGLVDAGWQIERPFQRMTFGPAHARVPEPPFAVAGPEYG